MPSAAEADRGLNDEGDDGWQAVLVLKHEEAYTHVLLMHEVAE
jgi:hypothetical protein